MRILIFISLMLPISSLWAVNKIEVQALFSNKAVLSIDGQRRVLAVGTTSPEGVKLIAADSKNALLEVDGKQKNYTLGSSVSLSYSKPKNVEESVYADDRGMYLSVGSINGQSVRFLLDTGATLVAMNRSQAKRLGLRYREEGERSGVSTASGYEKAYKIKLKSVTLGKIKQHNVDAVVIDGNHPGPILLGMSFLGKVKVQHGGNVMRLQQR